MVPLKRHSRTLGQVRVTYLGLRSFYDRPMSGRVILLHGTSSSGKTTIARAILRELPLKILRPRPGRWYSPRDRAKQLAEEAYGWDGKAPPKDVRCFYTHTDGGGAEWHLCSPDLITIACSPETTSEPLTGKSNRGNLSWGDCAID